jgi:hypothetical protein
MRGAEDVLDLAVGLGVVRAVLHEVELVGAHREGLQRLGVFRARDEGLGVGPRGDPGGVPVGT